MFVTRQSPTTILALATDLSEVYRLRSLVFSPAPGEHQVSLACDLKASTLHFLAFKSGRAVGCLSLAQQDLAMWQGVRIQLLAVDPALQHSGIGSALLQQAITDHAHRWPEKILWLSSVDSAKDFYLNKGFVPFIDAFESEHRGETIFIKS